MSDFTNMSAEPFLQIKLGFAWFHLCACTSAARCKRCGDWDSEWTIRHQSPIKSSPCLYIYTHVSLFEYIYIYSQGWFMYYVFRLYRTCLCVSVRVSRVGAYVYFLCAHHWKILCFPLHISLRDYIHLASTCLKILTQFLDAGCPFMLQTKMKHTHTYIYTYYINICLEPPFFFLPLRRWYWSGSEINISRPNAQFHGQTGHFTAS